MSYFKRKGFSCSCSPPSCCSPLPSLSRHFLFSPLDHMRDDGVGRGGRGWKRDRTVPSKPFCTIQFHPCASN